MRVYPSTGGTQTTVPQKAMPQVMGWDAYDGRLKVQGVDEQQLYVRGADSIVNCCIAFNATGLYSQYLLDAPAVANIGKSFWQTKDGNIYTVVDPVGDGNKEDLVYEVVDRNATQGLCTTRELRMSTQQLNLFTDLRQVLQSYIRTYITCDHATTSTHYGLYVESPTWSNDASVYDGTPNPQNTDWRINLLVFMSITLPHEHQRGHL